MIVFVWAAAVTLLGLALGVMLPRAQDYKALARYPVTVEVLAAARVQVQRLGSTRPTRVPAYERAEFGQAWADIDSNGCDTRNDILRRDLEAVTLAPGAGACVVQAGVLHDPYTGSDIQFARGSTSARVQIDHVVALADAWNSGAWAWDRTVRIAFANDPDNLLAVAGTANQDKGAATADQWTPPNAGFRCVYAIKQVQVKTQYALGVSDAERRALSRAIGSCRTAKPP
ncbi:uncharacterized protein DUF1524 [Rarobacter incanus]|uniref:Uncharacterized protein DUF1524 n=1 Tax=Rarobacter incanus TaxID=153494 RepID=A0A542SPX9_9MICO|nr:uncharacterized protein DUF1524 [Rarobacter incanus]